MITIPIISPLRDLLLSIEKRNEYVFNYRGKPIKSCSTALKSACRRAKIKYRSIHKLRHTCATWLLSKNVDLATIQKILGHKNIKSTMIYVHVLSDHQQKALDMTFNSDILKICSQICAHRKRLISYYIDFTILF